MEVKGKITAVIGAVVDAVFEGRVPRVHEAIYVPCPEQERTVWLECALLLPEGAVRCIALHATEGLVRGMAAFATGEAANCRIIHRKQCCRHFGLSAPPGGNSTIR